MKLLCLQMHPKGCQKSRSKSPSGRGKKKSRRRSTVKRKKKNQAKPTSLFDGKYEGDLAENIREGKGKLTFVNGDTYEGDFRHGYRWGKGIYITQKGKYTYRGEYVRSLKHGKGTEVFKNNDKYVGEYKNDLKDGQGKFLTGLEYMRVLTKMIGSMVMENGVSSGDSYENAQDGFMHGRGVYAFVTEDSMMANLSRRTGGTGEYDIQKASGYFKDN